MNIAIDAKRIMQNRSGLGSYGRNLVAGFKALPLQDKIILFAPKESDFYHQSFTAKSNICTYFHSKKMKSLWRSFGIKKDLEKHKIDIYHGISNEIPFSLKNQSKIKSIVDIHDLLFLRFPKYYPFFDRKIYEYKTKFACQNAQQIIATSQSTKADIVNYYGIAEEKIKVVYQSCSDSFFQAISKEEKEKIRQKYQLPQNFALCVGSIEHRKNQLRIVEALSRCKNQIPLLLIGGSNAQYKAEIVAKAKQLKVKLLLPKQFVPNADLPALYQLAHLMLFPALAEGFGIPVLEAMASKTPVITSLNTSMAEIVQDNDCLVNPLSTGNLTEKIDDFLQQDLTEKIEQNYRRALAFTPKAFAQNILNIYDEFRH